MELSCAVVTNALASVVGAVAALCVAPCAYAQLPAQVREQMERESRAPEDRVLHDDLQEAAAYWYRSRNPRHLPDMEEALAQVMPKALQLSGMVTEFQSWEQAQKMKAYHNAGAVLLSKAYTLLYYGESKKAAPVIELIEQKFRYAMCLYQDREVLWVRQRLRFHQHASMLYRAMSLKTVGKLTFPPERDEFDGPEQRRALENMAVLRLKEGNFDFLEHYFNAINESGLQTTGGEWAIHIILDAMKPVPWETESNEAWKEIYDAIKLWQSNQPGSEFAKLAEARFALHYAWFALDNGGKASYPDFRERAEHGLGLVQKIPKISPAWYETTVGLMALHGSLPEDYAPIYREGLGKYHRYSPLVIALFKGLASMGEPGYELCAQGFEEMAADGDGAVAAHVLRRMLFNNQLQRMLPRLDGDVAEKVIRAAIAEWPDSYELRSDLGLVAVTIGRRQLARDLMKNMKGKWDRRTWKGREDLATALALPADA